MNTVALLVLSAFVVGAALGAVMMYLYRSATVEATKQRFADELHRLIEREERARQIGRQDRHAA
jgi:uncharacterized membrane protein